MHKDEKGGLDNLSEKISFIFKVIIIIIQIKTIKRTKPKATWR